MRFLLGKPLSYAKSGLKPNSVESVKISVTDGLGKRFRSEKKFEVSPSGLLSIDKTQFRNFIGTTGTKSNDCFLIPEFDNFSVDLEGQNFKDQITVGCPVYIDIWSLASITAHVSSWTSKISLQWCRRNN